MNFTAFDKTGCASAKDYLKTAFSFASAFAFHYL